MRCFLKFLRCLHLLQAYTVHTALAVRINDESDERATVEQRSPSNTTFSRTEICAGVTSMVLVVCGKNTAVVLRFLSNSMKIYD